MRFFFYSHDGLGLGHTRRHLAIAAALIDLAPQASILVATGADEINRLGLPPQVEIVKLPSLRKVANGKYISRRLKIPVNEIRALRSSLLEASVRSFRPDVVLVDKHPLGPSEEFRAALELARENGAHTVLGLRDILDEPSAVLEEWNAGRVQERLLDFYDMLLVYGDRRVFDPVMKYNFSPAIAERTNFCGYVVNHDQDPPDALEQSPVLNSQNRPVVLATTGGGEDGYLLLQSFIRAAVGMDWRGIVVTGPMTPENEVEELQRLALDSRVAFHSFVPHLSSLFWSVDGLVCMGGYNTLVEAASRGVPTVCIPRVSPRSEQLLRAQCFAQLGLLRMVRPEELSVDALRREIGLALKTSRQELIERANAALHFDGARHAAAHLLGLSANSRAATLRSEAGVLS